MRIRTQLFLGTAILVLGLVAIQWWLQTRQLKAVEQELAKVARNVSQSILIEGSWMQKNVTTITNDSLSPTTIDHISILQDKNHTLSSNVEIAVIDDKGERRDKKIVIPSQDLEHLTTQANGNTIVNGKTIISRRMEMNLKTDDVGSDKFLVISGLPGGERVIPIGIQYSTDIVRRISQQGLMAGGVLLLVGLITAGMFANRVTQPLRHLVERVDVLSSGEFGTQVEVTAKGEVRELQVAFNHLSARLVSLEAEKKEWQAREHLAELGDLARGLGHTLRNPLNTLGLVVEELALRGARDAEELVATARSQIHRIDHWLRSFLALGVGSSVAPEVVDLADLVNDVVLEVAQHGTNIEVECEATPLQAKVVPPALRSALTNLISNAVEASPKISLVRVLLEKENGQAIIKIIDQGSGLPTAVRERLFTPHVTTKIGGSGMGLFLAKQLIENGHHGKLEILDQPTGTMVMVRLPLLTYNSASNEKV